MKKLVTGLVLIISSVAQAEPQAAIEFGQTLGGAFCRDAKRIHANGAPLPPQAARPIETTQDVFICKEAISRVVGQDQFCHALYSGQVSLTMEMQEKIVETYNLYEGFCDL